jgi:hypothetical protein
MPSLIHWPIVAAAGACAVVLLAGTLAAACFASRAASAPKQRPASVAEVPVPARVLPLPDPVEEPAALPAARSTEEGPVASIEQPKPSELASLPSPGAPTCESFGTRVEFVRNPTDAARLAREENKLMFVLHISGNFEDDKFT